MTTDLQEFSRTLFAAANQLLANRTAINTWRKPRD